MATPPPRRCLVVDDDPALRTLMSVTLEAAGLDVDTAVDGPSARAAIATSVSPYAMVVADRRLGIDDDGVDVLRLAAQTDTATLLVLVTAQTDPDLIAMTDGAGFVLVDKMDVVSLPELLDGHHTA